MILNDFYASLIGGGWPLRSWYFWYWYYGIYQLFCVMVLRIYAYLSKNSTSCIQNVYYTKGSVFEESGWCEKRKKVV